MLFKTRAGDYTFRFSIAAGDFEHFCSGLQLFDYKIEIHKKRKYVEPYRSDIYEEMGITQEEFKTLLVEGTKQVIGDLLHEVIEENPATRVRSFVFFAVDDGGSTYENLYGFSQHDIFEEISDESHLIHSQGYDGGKTYVHTKELIPELDHASFLLGFDYYGDDVIIETVRSKIEMNQFTDDDEDIDEIVDEVLEELL